jgi:heptosyltransferase I
VTDSLQRVLLVKTSSMGDLVHTLSAIQEAVQTRGNIQIDWVCEEAFADVARLAPAIDRILPVAIRRWRTSLGSAATRAEIKRFKQTLQARDYDLVIDAQGLLKTAWITWLARCKNANRWGYDWVSAREPLASLAVNHKVNAPAQWHAIQRLRSLFGAALGYKPTGEVSSLRGPRHPEPAEGGREGAVATHSEIMLLHGTSRSEKSWPIDSWVELGRALAAQGYTLLLPWGSAQEQEQATQIAQHIGQDYAQVLPKLGIGELAQKLQRCAGAIGVDSGLMHLSVALGRPTVAVMSASHLPKFSADRFAPFWAPHARVVQRESQADSITPAAVLRAWSALC